jgi:predicted PurR-regulated permease PerM
VQLAEKFSQSEFAHRFHLEKSLSLATLSEKIGTSATASAQIILSSLRTLLETGSQIVLVFIFTILMVAMRDHLRRTFEKLLAQFEHIHSAHILDAVVTLIEQFLLARMVVMISVSALSWVVLFLFGVPYSFLLGTLVGILTVIPEVGFVVSLVPVIVVAVAAGVSLLSVTCLLLSFFVIHLIEANVFSPKLVGHKLNINVLASFIGLFGGGLIWGVWGMFLSVPVLGVLRIVLSAIPSLQTWGELLAEREDRALTRQIIQQHKLALFLKFRKPAKST